MNDRAMSEWFALTNVFRMDYANRELPLRSLGSCYNPNKKNGTRKRPKRNKQFGKNKK